MMNIMASCCHNNQVTNCHEFSFSIGNMLQSHSKSILADNLKKIAGGADSQKFREQVAKKSGTSARSIGYMLSPEDGNPTLKSIEAVSNALGYTVAQLLSENLGRPRPESSDTPSPFIPAEPAQECSPRIRNIFDRLQRAEASGSASPAFLNALEALIELVDPNHTVNPDDYAKLNHAIDHSE